MSVLIRPIITEKMTSDSELYNRYGFVVDPSANKLQIKEAVEAAYGVSVTSVRTMNYGPQRWASPINRWMSPTLCIVIQNSVPKSCPT